MKEIPLSKGYSAIVDDEDFDYLNQWKWTWRKGYATRTVTIAPGVRELIIMHRILLNAPDGVFVDHINMNGLDNRRENLRLADRTQNNANRKKPTGLHSSMFKGVSWFKLRKAWRADIKVNRKCVHLGVFDCEVEAAKAYNFAAIEYFGAYAQLNEIP